MGQHFERFRRRRYCCRPVHRQAVVQSFLARALRNGGLSAPSEVSTGGVCYKSIFRDGPDPSLMSCMERVRSRNLGSHRRRIGALARINAVALALALGATACTDSAPQAGAATVPAGAAVIPVITQAARVEPMGIEIE